MEAGLTDLNAFAFTRKGNALIPSDIHAADFLEGIKDGKEVLVSIKKPRSVKHHRRVFALLQLVLDNTEQWQGDKDALLSDLKMATRLVDVRVDLITGREYIVPRSISFASLDQISFDRWWRRAVHVIATQVLNTLPDEIEREIMAAMDPQSHDRAKETLQV